MRKDLKFRIRRFMVIWLPILIGIILFIYNNINKEDNYRLEEYYISNAGYTSLWSIYNDIETGYSWTEQMYYYDIDNPEIGEYLQPGDTIQVRVKEVK